MTGQCHPARGREEGQLGLQTPSNHSLRLPAHQGELQVSLGEKVPDMTVQCRHDSAVQLRPTLKASTLGKRIDRGEHFKCAKGDNGENSSY